MMAKDTDVKELFLQTGYSRQEFREFWVFEKSIMEDYVKRGLLHKKIPINRLEALYKAYNEKKLPIRMIHYYVTKYFRAGSSKWERDSKRLFDEHQWVKRTDNVLAELVMLIKKGYKRFVTTVNDKKVSPASLTKSLNALNAIVPSLERTKKITEKTSNVTLRVGQMYKGGRSVEHLKYRNIWVYCLYKILGSDEEVYKLLHDSDPRQTLSNDQIVRIIKKGKKEFEPLERWPVLL